MDGQRLFYVTVSGSPEELGFNQGYKLRQQIQNFVEQRLRSANAYMWERGIRDMPGFFAAAKRSLALYKEWDNEGYREHMAMAEGARVDATSLWGTTNMTDIRDVVLFGQQEKLVGDAAEEGCTALVLPKGKTHSEEIIGAQTWDLNPGDIDYVVAIHRLPDEGPETWSVTCSGCLTLMGMNEHGLSLGTTNIKCNDVRDGIPYLGLLHRAIRCEDHFEAVDVIENAPRSGAHTYWVADANDATLLECSAQSSVHRNLGADAICQTNHCQDASLVAIQAEAPIESTKARLNKATELCNRGEHDVESIKALFANRDDDIHSINRYEEDEQGTTTNSCMIAIPAQKELWACKGPADRGEWRQLHFKR